MNEDQSQGSHKLQNQRILRQSGKSQEIWPSELSITNLSKSTKNLVTYDLIRHFAFYVQMYLDPSLKISLMMLFRECVFLIFLNTHHFFKKFT